MSRIAVPVAIVLGLVLAQAPEALAQKAKMNDAQCAPALAVAAPPSERWAAWQPLLGEWEGTGGPGAPVSGVFTFLPDLGSAVLVRKHKALVGAAKEGQPAPAVHEDLMIVFPVGREVRANYFDNEGLAIKYVVTPARDGKSFVFDSPASGDQPAFRLTYRVQAEGEVAVLFEMSPTGKADAFRKVVEGTAKRKALPPAPPAPPAPPPAPPAPPAAAAAPPAPPAPPAPGK